MRSIGSRGVERTRIRRLRHPASAAAADGGPDNGGPRAAAPWGATGAPRPVLLVEPDATTRALHRQELERAGFTVVEARSGEEAIWTVFRLRPCAVVMACAVPGVSGIRAAEVLKDEPGLQDIPVVLLASTGDADEHRRASEAPCDAYLSDRSGPDPVVRAVRRLTGCAAGPGPAAAPRTAAGGGGSLQAR